MRVGRRRAKDENSVSSRVHESSAFAERGVKVSLRLSLFSSRCATRQRQAGSAHSQKIHDLQLPPRLIGLVHGQATKSPKQRPWLPCQPVVLLMKEVLMSELRDPCAKITYLSEDLVIKYINHHIHIICRARWHRPLQSEFATRKNSHWVTTSRSSASSSTGRYSSKAVSATTTARAGYGPWSTSANSSGEATRTHLHDVISSMLYTETTLEPMWEPGGEP